jgi:RNA-binding protein
MALNGKQKRQLRGLGHHLEPVVQVGANGVTAGVIDATAQALKDHELIKVKFAEDDREGRAAAISLLSDGTGSEVAQTLGRTVLLYKARKKKSKIALVGAPKPPPELTEAPKKPTRPAPPRRPRR